MYKCDVDEGVQYRHHNKYDILLSKKYTSLSLGIEDNSKKGMLA